jgi:S1-C subfamily serine protease
MAAAAAYQQGVGMNPTRRLLGVAIALATLAVVVIAVAGCSNLGRGDSASARSSGTAIPVVPEAAAFQRQLVSVVKAVSPAVVQIQTETGLGSGVVFDSSGDLVTNAHVVDGSKVFLVTLSGGGRHTARLVGVDRGHDLAVVRMNGAGPGQASFADSSKVQVGDIAIAIGNPLGLRSSVTQGVVSSLDRKVSEENGVTLSSTIQTSAEINPGNSGGALVDLSGRVIGIPTLAATDPQLGGGAAPGIGFAIPSNTVDKIAGGLIASAGE